MLSSDDAGEGLADPDRTSPGEWALGVLGGLVAVALLVFLGHQALVRDDPPQLDVVVTEVRQTSGGEFVATLRVENSGGATAEAVEVTGEVRRAGGIVASSSATVSYVPADSHRTASLVFDVDPTAPGADLQAGVRGYTSM